MIRKLVKYAKSKLRKPTEHFRLKNPLFRVFRKCYHCSVSHFQYKRNLKEFSVLLKEMSRKHSYEKYVPGRVILINAGLAAGGAERQVVNTLIGLQKQAIESVTLLCENLDSARGLDFYLPFLRSHHVPVEVIQSTANVDPKIFLNLDADMKSLLSYLPPYPTQSILNLYLEFKTRQPEVVHAWQDSTSIISAIAAIMAGVPHIVIGTRNVTPVNFAYYQPYMWMGYKALVQLDKVTFINNSQAGAKDYTSWLGLPLDRFNVVRNGLDLSYLDTTVSNMAESSRLTLGIPETAEVVGSIFRFYPEKRPLLWIETAIKLAEKSPRYHFLIAGDGPLKPEMLALVEKANLGNRIHFVGVKSDILPILSAMDVFLLTSRFEGTPNVVLEAQWVGVPVVAMDAGGTAEAVLEGVTGLISHNPDPETLAEMLDGVMPKLDWRRKVKEEGPKFVKAYFGINSMLECTMRLYNL